jgi:hypothetical protein
MTLPPMVRKRVAKDCAGNEMWLHLFLVRPCIHGDVFMAGILLWLMGVPLLVIILLYLIF